MNSSLRLLTSDPFGSTALSSYVGYGQVHHVLDNRECIVSRVAQTHNLLLAHDRLGAQLPDRRLRGGQPLPHTLSKARLE